MKLTDLVMPSWVKPALIALVLISVGGFSAYKMHEHDQKKYDKLAAEYQQFKGGVKALGEAAIRQKAITEATQERNKERADEENRNRASAIAATIRSLRSERDDARRRFLSSAPAGSKCPDGQTCFDTAKYLAAYGILVDEVRAFADECTAVTIDLDTAKVWARSVRP